MCVCASARALSGESLQRAHRAAVLPLGRDWYYYPRRTCFHFRGRLLIIRRGSAIRSAGPGIEVLPPGIRLCSPLLRCADLLCGRQFCPETTELCSTGRRRRGSLHGFLGQSTGSERVDPGYERQDTASNVKGAAMSAKDTEGRDHERQRRDHARQGSNKDETRP